MKIKNHGLANELATRYHSICSILRRLDVSEPKGRAIRIQVDTPNGNTTLYQTITIQTPRALELIEEALYMERAQVCSDYNKIDDAD